MLINPLVILINQFVYMGSLFRSLSTLILIGVAAICNGQSDSAKMVSCPSPEVKISFNSSLIYPGISAGAGLMIKERAMPGHKRKSGSCTITRSQFGIINLNWYHHPGFHDNLYLTAEWSLRKIRKSGYYSEFSAGPGYSRTFLGGNTHHTDNKGDVYIKKHAGYNYAMLTIGGGLGFDFSSLEKAPVSVFAKMNLITMFPYNNTLYFRPVLELGVRLNTIFFSRINKKN